MNYFRIKDLTEQEISRLLVKAQEEDDNVIESVIFKITTLETKIASKRAEIDKRAKHIKGNMEQLQQDLYEHGIYKPEDRQLKQLIANFHPGSFITIYEDVKELNDLEEQVSFLKNLNFKKG